MSDPSNERSEYHDRTDYISNLPDAIISYILAFIPTKSAVKTSILSRRWKYIWTKVPVLDFNEMPDSLTRECLNYEQDIYFEDFVDRVLLQNVVSNLQWFRLVFYSEHEDKMKSWFNAVKMREICELDLQLVRNDRIYLPSELLSSQRLVVLKLDNFLIDDMQVSFHLPNLEIIHFIGLHFPGDLFLKSFISGSPVLKELLIRECDGFDKTLSVESLTLTSLEICETVSQSDSELSCINIKAPNLSYLSLHDYLAYYDIGDLNFLTEVNLELWDVDEYDGIDYHALQLIKKVSGVRTLRLGRYDVICFEGAIPTFQNLTHLKLKADFFAYELLLSTPNLKYLIIEQVECVDTHFFSRVVPRCMSCLESVEFFLDKKHHINLVAYILEAATTLKKMIIYLHHMSMLHERTVYQSLLNLPRSSSICQVKVVHLN